MKFAARKNKIRKEIGTANFATMEFLLVLLSFISDTSLILYLSIIFVINLCSDRISQISSLTVKYNLAIFQTNKSVGELLGEFQKMCIRDRGNTIHESVLLDNELETPLIKAILYVGRDAIYRDNETASFGYFPGKTNTTQAAEKGGNGEYLSLIHISARLICSRIRCRWRRYVYCSNFIQTIISR